MGDLWPSDARLQAPRFEFMRRENGVVKFQCRGCGEHFEGADPEVRKAMNEHYGHCDSLPSPRQVKVTTAAVSSERPPTLPFDQYPAAVQTLKRLFSRQQSMIASRGVISDAAWNAKWNEVNATLDSWETERLAIIASEGSSNEGLAFPVGLIRRAIASLPLEISGGPVGPKQFIGYNQFGARDRFTPLKSAMVEWQISVATVRPGDEGYVSVMYLALNNAYSLYDLACKYFTPEAES